MQVHFPIYTSISKTSLLWIFFQIEMGVGNQLQKTKSVMKLSFGVVGVAFGANGLAIFSTQSL
jgi:hypothetical protein